MMSNKDVCTSSKACISPPLLFYHVCCILLFLKSQQCCFMDSKVADTQYYYDQAKLPEILPSKAPCVCCKRPTVDYGVKGCEQNKIIRLILNFNPHIDYPFEQFSATKSITSPPCKFIPHNTNAY